MMDNNLEEMSSKTCCVFGASSAQINEAYLTAAGELGGLLARGGWRVVTGGGSVGLMGAVADGALQAGGHVTGVIPQFMVERGWCYDRLPEVVVTADMHQRKRLMSDMADAIVALPGGVGTLEEVLEAMTWRQLGLTSAPIVLLNTMGYYDKLLEQLSVAIEQGFMREDHAALWQVAETPAQVMALLEGDVAAGPVTFKPKY